MFDVFHQDRLYAFGNSADLHELMTKLTGNDSRVIYFGDHIKSDINALKFHTDWYAAVVIEELEFDLPPQTEQTFRYHSSRRRTSHSYQVGHRSKYFYSFFVSADDLFSLRPTDTLTSLNMLIQLEMGRLNLSYPTLLNLQAGM
jgi:hypothetical protein